MEPAGYISSLVTQETKCGSFDSPWWIAVKPGQTLQITLLDFEEMATTPCTVYAVIKVGRGSGKAKLDCAGIALSNTATQLGRQVAILVGQIGCLVGVHEECLGAISPMVLLRCCETQV
jgi:hypothetical protein